MVNVTSCDYGYTVCLVVIHNLHFRPILQICHSAADQSDIGVQLFISRITMVTNVAEVALDSFETVFIIMR